MFKHYKFENNVTNNFSLKVVTLVFLMLPFLLSSFAWKKTKKCKIVSINALHYSALIQKQFHDRASFLHVQKTTIKYDTCFYNQHLHK